MRNRMVFWGVRGSVAAPGPDTARVGGNTTCNEVCLGGERIIIDGGTGLRSLGTAWGPRPMAATILFSHLHWDHIQGVPFFVPLYHPQSRFQLIGPAGLRSALERQMSRPSFPVGMDVMGAGISFHEIAPGEELRLGSVEVTTAALHHPGGAIAYRLEHEGASVVHALDHEHGDEDVMARLEELSRGAGLLLYDSQYLPEEYLAKVGWGHSTYVEGADLARRARVERLLLTHHDPLRSDAQVAHLEAAARRLYVRAQAAREGLIVDLETSHRVSCLKAS